MHEHFNHTLKRDIGNIDLEFQDQAVSTAKVTSSDFIMPKPGGQLSHAAEQIYGDKKSKEERNTS